VNTMDKEHIVTCRTQAVCISRLCYQPMFMKRPSCPPYGWFRFALCSAAAWGAGTGQALDYCVPSVGHDLPDPDRAARPPTGAVAYKGASRRMCRTRPKATTMTAADQQRAARATRTGEAWRPATFVHGALDCSGMADGLLPAGGPVPVAESPPARLVARVRGGGSTCGVREATAGPIPSATTSVPSVGGSHTTPLLRLVHEPVRTA